MTAGEDGANTSQASPFDDPFGELPRDSGRQIERDARMFRFVRRLEIAHRACERIRMEDFEIDGEMPARW